jgi:hypothetical protein
MKYGVDPSVSVITNPDDPKFDLEKFVEKWERENEPRK